MPISDAKKRANAKWNEANLKDRYDRIQIVVPKGYKEQIEHAATCAGERSVSKYIVDAVRERMQREQSARGFGISDPADKQE